MNNTIKTNQSCQKFKELLTARHIISRWLIMSSVFSEWFQIVLSVMMSGQQPACHPMIVICLINKVGAQFNA